MRMNKDEIALQKAVDSGDTELGKILRNSWILVVTFECHIFFACGYTRQVVHVDAGV